MTTSTPMSSEAKGLLSKTIRDLRERLLQDFDESLRQEYKLGIDASRAKLHGTAAIRRARLDRWTHEQLRCLPDKDKQAASKQPEPILARFRHDVVKQAGYTLLNRLVYLRLLEAAKLRKTAVLTGGWQSPGYRDFRELAPGLLLDDAEGYALLLRIVFDDLALDLPGLYGRNGLADLVPVPAETLRYVVEQLDRSELASCWTDDMTLGWVYQYWNDPEREALDAKLNDGGKVERHEIASKTQMFTERYMVDWLLQNSLGPMWLAMCKKHGWTPLAEQHGTLERLEQRRVDWRAKRDAGEVSLTDLMPLDSDEERHWAYYVPQPIPDDAVSGAPDSVRSLKLLDPALGSGHFLVVAFDLLVALYREEAAHRGEIWTDKDIVESILTNNLYGVDLDPRAVQIAAAALWLKARGIANDAAPASLNLVASNLRLAGLAEDDPALVSLREAVQSETGIPAGLTDSVVQALKGADYLGSLLEVGDALDQAIERYGKAQQGDMFGEPLVKKIEFDAGDAKGRLIGELEGFLAAHTGSADLGLRLRGEQLAAGVRFLRIIREGEYDLVVGNPPYQGTSKLVDAGYVKDRYPLGKADLYAAFLVRGLALVREGGVSALLTMRNWMFIKQFAELRKWVLATYDLRALGDLAVGAFDDVPNDLLSVVVSIFRASGPTTTPSIAAQPTPPDDASYDRARTQRKRAATLCQVGRHEFDPASLKVVPEWPLVYWWSDHDICLFEEHTLIGKSAPCKVGIVTGNNTRFTRHHTELPAKTGWKPYVGGAQGTTWFDPCDSRLNWVAQGLETKVLAENTYGSHSRQIRNEHLYFQIGIACTAIGSNFGARIHLRPSVIGSSAASIFPDDLASALCLLNSGHAQAILQSLNPGVHFEVGDINRLPMVAFSGAEAICKVARAEFLAGEEHREPSVEFLHPGPSPWTHAQAWAQLAVDRPENTPLPPYTEHLTPEPPSDHLSFALGVALGRFGSPPLTEKPGILDPSTDKLDHALPDGVLFLDGTLPADSQADSLGHPIAALLHEAWKTHGPALASKRGNLRDWLRLDFFDLHRSMYENRPIHWPLSSEKKTFVAWINIHRWHAGTLRTLLADHLNPATKRLDGQLADLRAARDSGDPKAARAAEKRLEQLQKSYAELTQFIADVSTCAERGPASADPKHHPKRDAPYDPDLDDGVMVNSSALWPLLQPQWRDPKKWWKELCQAKGRKDYDWSQLAAKYFPDRVDAKSKLDPSLAVAHGCFWKYHPARAFAWELRLQDEIDPEFTIDEDWGKSYQGVSNSVEAHDKFTTEHPDESDEIYRKEIKRRDRKQAKEQGDRETALFAPSPPTDTGEAQ